MSASETLIERLRYLGICLSSQSLRVDAAVVDEAMAELARLTGEVARLQTRRCEDIDAARKTAAEWAAAAREDRERAEHAEAEVVRVTQENVSLIEACHDMQGEKTERDALMRYVVFLGFTPERFAAWRKLEDETAAALHRDGKDVSNG